jgi:hypothetical protein
MNTCIKCGCQDAYPSLPPCPTPAACPNPQPCAEVFDAQCIVFTLPDILCGEDIVVNQDDTIAEALDGIVSYFCEEIIKLTLYINSQLLIINNNLTTIEGEIIEINSKITSLTTTVNELIACCELVDGLVQSVTGLNTDNTDPQNPIVKISVDGSTITGLGTPASPLIAIGGITGSGTNNYIARWTPNGTTLGTGLIRDSGLNVGVNTVPLPNYTFKVVGTDVYTLTSINSSTSGGLGIFGIANGTNSSINYGSVMQASGSINLNVGTKAEAIQATVGTNVGLYGVALLGSSNYAAQFQDGSEDVGKVLTCVTADGKANWETTNKQKVITTSNYVLTDADNDYTIFINNGVTAISISLGAITVANFCVGFIQEGSADVTFVGVTNPVGLKLKGQGYQAFIERKLSTATYYLLGNTKV